MRNTGFKKLDPSMKRIQEEAQKQQELLKRLQESDGDKKITREIKYQMNLLTADNFDVIKLQILKIAQEESFFNVETPWKK